VRDLENPKHRATFYFTNDYGALTSKGSPLYDTEMYQMLKKVNDYQTMYIFTDCCHSGTIFNLPFVTLGNFMFKYDNSGNIATETVQETDDLGHPIYDANGNPIYIKQPLYETLTYDPSNNVLSGSDISGLLGDANTVLPVGNTGTFNTKINFQSAEFPSLTDMQGNIIHFAGTRDNKFSFEATQIDSSGNSIQDGAFTWNFIRLANYGLDKLKIKDFHTCLIGLINNTNQIPMCSTSKFILYSNNNYLTDFTPSNTGPANKINFKLKNKKKLINKKPNIIKYFNIKNLKDIKWGAFCIPGIADLDDIKKFGIIISNVPIIVFILILLL